MLQFKRIIVAIKQMYNIKKNVKKDKPAEFLSPDLLSIKARSDPVVTIKNVVWSKCL